MKFLIVSEAGDGVGLALRLQAEGHDARMFIKEERGHNRAKGLVRLAEESSFGECIVADCTGSGPLLDELAAEGRRVFGGSSIMDRLENDREYSDQVMREAGIRTPQSESFDDWDQAATFIKAVKKTRLVFKPEGILSGVIPSYTPHDNAELLEALDHFKTLLGSSKPQFTLQEFVPGIAVSTEGWYDGTKWIQPFNHTLERKHLMDGEIGPSGGCTGNVVWPCDAGDSIVQKGLSLLEPFLARHLYRGAIDLNSIVTEDGEVYGLEFTPRFGYDALPTFLSLYTGDFGRLLWDCASGDGPDHMDIAEGFAAGVRITVPPWPHEKFPLAESGVPVRGLDREDLVSAFYPYDIESRDGAFYTSGGYGIVGVANGLGRSVGEAFSRAYLAIANIHIPDMQYRTDLGKVCEHDLRELEFAIGLRFKRGWKGVDLDNTLAQYSGSIDAVGSPIPKMVARVKRWLRDGSEVRIVTARAGPGDDGKIRHDQILAVHDFIREHIGTPLPVTAEKDFEMTRLYDDCVTEVEPGTGELVK